jgi:hypothetical protein
MKFYPSTNANTSKGLLIFCLMSIAVLTANTLSAQQRSRPGQKMYLGVEGSIGTRSFSIKSDIPALNRMPVSTAGVNFGLVFGNKVFHTKLKQGYFKSAESVSEKLKTIETEAVVNVYPLQLKKMKFRYFEPYLITGADRGTMKMFGTYTSQIQGSATPGTLTPGSGVQTPGTGTGTVPDPAHGQEVVCGLPGNPDGTLVTTPADANANSDQNQSGDGTLGTGTDPLFQVDPYLGKIVNTRVNVGFGLECHIPGKHHFVNLFAELKYGIPVSATTSDEAFKNTKVSGVLAVSFGVSFGFAK